MSEATRRREAEDPGEVIGYTGSGRIVYENSPPSRKRLVRYAKIEQKPKAELDIVTDGAIGALPAEMRKVAGEIALDPLLNRGIAVTMQRWEGYSSPTAALLSGIAIDEGARIRFDEALDARWSRETMPKGDVSEVVVGGGLHAAVYCAIRAKAGKPKPLVLEQRIRVGGVFAVSRKPAFFLNSRNRPGPLSIPGEMGSLNFMPGAMIQPSELGGAEYQTNDALAWVVRMTLAMYANVLPERSVTKLDRLPNGRVRVTYRVGGLSSVTTTDRVIIAGGLGEPNDPTGLIGMEPERIFTYERFMAKMDEPYPLRGMERVAVIGGGDGAKTVIEGLAGKGPSRGYSVAALDWPKKIDWYGCPYATCDQWVANNRSRYKGIGSLLPDPTKPERPFRVQPKGTVAEGSCSIGFDCVYVAEQPYDTVIVAAGYKPGGLRDVLLGGSYDWAYVNGRKVGYRNKEIYMVGPTVEITPSAAEEAILGGISENTTSVFRWAPRTAALAASLA